MEVIRQVYESSPDVITITVPEELRARPLEVILQPLEEEPDIQALAAEWGVKPEDILDPGILKFAGCLPDFPPRAPQETGEEFDRE